MPCKLQRCTQCTLIYVSIIWTESKNLAFHSFLCAVRGSIFFFLVICNLATHYNKRAASVCISLKLLIFVSTDRGFQVACPRSIQRSKLKGIICTHPTRSRQNTTTIHIHSKHTVMLTVSWCCHVKGRSWIHWVATNCGMVTTDWQHFHFYHLPGTISASSIGHSSLSITKGDGAHQTKTQTQTVLKEQTEGALSKALLVAGLVDPGHRLLLLVLYSSQRFQVLVSEAATSIVT